MGKNKYEKKWNQIDRLLMAWVRYKQSKLKIIYGQRGKVNQNHESIKTSVLITSFSKHY